MKTFLNTCFELFAIIQVGHSNLTSLRGYLPMYSLFTFICLFFVVIMFVSVLPHIPEKHFCIDFFKLKSANGT